MSDLTIRTSEVMSNLTLSIRIDHDMNLRIWLGSQILRLAGLVLGCKAEIEVKDSGTRI